MLYVAFWLELDNPVWAGNSAAIVCQPHLGASLRKGWYHMIGTLVSAVAFAYRRGTRQPATDQLSKARAERH